MSPVNRRKLWGIVLAGGDGTRVRDFLAQLCGGSGIKQFCAVIGRRSMLEHTLARVERLIPRDRTLVIVSQDHREEAAQQISSLACRQCYFSACQSRHGSGDLVAVGARKRATCSV